MAQQIEVEDPVNKYLAGSKVTSVYVPIIITIFLADMLEFFDFGILSVTMPIWTTSWHLTGFEIGLLVSTVGIGGTVGAFVLPALSDRVGRRPIFVWTLLLLAVSTALIGLVPERGLGYVYVLRIFQGLAIGGLYAIDYTIIQEMAPARIRGTLTGSVSMLLPLGLAIASFLGALLLPNWRLLYFIGAVPAVLSLVGRLFMPETPRSLYVRRKFGEAAKSIAFLLRVKDASWISNVEKEFADFYEKNPPKLERWYSQFVILARKWREFIGVVALTGFTIGFVWYMISPYIPLYLELNYHMAAAAAAAIYGTISLTMVATRFAASAVTDVIGRKATIILVLAITAVGAFATAPLLGSAALLWALLPLAYGIDSSYSPTFVYANELYPTRSRSTASGTTYTIARIASIISPIILGIYLGTPPSLQHAWPSFAIAGILAIIAIIGILLLRLPEMKGHGLKA